MDNKQITTFIDFEPNWAKDENLRRKYKEELQKRLLQEIPNMVTRIAEIEPIITIEVGEYINFLREAKEAYQFGLWRAAIALVGIASESFTDILYSANTGIKTTSGEMINKEALFGRDDYLPEKRKLTVLYTYGIILKQDYEKLLKIKKIRDKYVHPKEKTIDVQKDASEIIKLFYSVIKGRFEREYTIKQGKIVKREKG